MQYSRVLVAVFAVLMAALFVVANPVPVVSERQLSGITNEITGSTGGITSDPGSTASGATAGVVDTVKNLLNEILGLLRTFLTTLQRID